MLFINRRPSFGLADAFDRSVYDEAVRGERFGDLIRHAGMMLGRGADFDGDVAARVTPRREEVRVDDDVPRAALDQPREAFRDVRLRDLKERALNQPEVTAPADAPRGLKHVPVRLLAPAAVPYDQHAPRHPLTHAVTPVSSVTPRLSNSSVVWRAMKH